uniref:AH domain-containing protein n=1 Tax=Syphacia muris TaxID=451379 RepID=A0A0N5ACV9_9BILA
MKFIKWRSDVMIKLELLDQKHVQDIGSQLATFVRLMLTTYETCQKIIEPIKGLFPIEVDFVKVIQKYNTSVQLNGKCDEVDKNDDAQLQSLDEKRLADDNSTEDLLDLT